MRPVDLLHLNSAGAEVAPIAGRLAGAPVVLATWHVDSTYDLDNLRGAWNHRALEMASMRSLHHSISVSRATACDWVRRCKLGDSAWNRITVIPNGVATESLQPPEDREAAKRKEGLDGRVVIASMGRLDAAKGYEHLVRALPMVLAGNPHVLVRIAGSGPLREHLESLAASLGVAGAIQFLGYTSGIQQFLAAADIYVQPSLCEAMPFAVLEAGATGLPVVAADVGGVAECVAQNTTGLVVPARDPESLAEALARLAASPEIRRRMGEAGRRRVLENFRVDQMTGATVAVYRNLLGRS